MSETPIQLTKDALKDYEHLDASLRKDIDKKIDRLRKNPFVGLPLGNNSNVDLNGFYKIYACKKSIRIVYRIINSAGRSVVEIWGIGKRERLEIYKSVFKRLKRKK